MEYNKENLDELIKQITEAQEISLTDIPCVDLYMDQVTTFFDDKLGSLKRDDEEKILTKTMINNYTKAKILMPAEKKKYSKEHMILLTLIYNLKQSLSINDINTILNPIIDPKSQNYKNISLEHIYNNFLEIKNFQNEEFYEILNSSMKCIKDEPKENHTDEEDFTEILLMILMLTNQANMQKRLAEKLIDNFFKK